MFDIDSKTLVSDINATLKLLEERTAIAKKAFGIKPDIAAVRKAWLEADDGLNLIAIMILRAKHAGMEQPPDVIERVNKCNDELVHLAGEIVNCEKIIFSHLAKGTHSLLN
jgi:hypothetical protein